MIGFQYIGPGSTANYVGIGVTAPTTLCITAGGNVGIATTNPGYLLDIGSSPGFNAGIQIRNGSGNSAIGTSAYPQIIMSYNGTSSNAHWIATRHNGGAGAGNAIDFYMWTAGQSATLGSTLMMSVTSLGVGIGISNPSNLLTVGASADPVANSPGTTRLVVNGNINCNRNRLIFSGSAIDRNHSIYNNFFNLDNEGVWDGMKFNVFNGASFRVGNADGAVPTTALYINSTGSIGIGITNPGYTLHVVGSIYATGDITAFSDKRYKDNIIPLTQSLDLLTQLTGYSYTRSDLRDKENIGLIAQEVKEVFPQAVTYDDELELYSLNYGCLIAPVIQAIKELKQTVNKLQEKVDKQDAIIQIFLDHYGPPQ
jgi:hypothetical protein